MEYKKYCPEVLVGPAYCSSAHIPEKQTAAFRSHVRRSKKNLCFSENRRWSFWYEYIKVKIELSFQWQLCAKEIFVFNTQSFLDLTFPSFYFL